MEAPKNIGFSITNNYDSIAKKEVFSELLKVLMAYSYSLIGNGSLRHAKGRNDLAYDFSMEAIEMHLKNPDKFNPLKNSDLVKYLKYYILRRLISNFRGLKGQKNELIYEPNDENGLIVKNKFLKENDIHNILDLQELLRKIQLELNGNNALLDLFDLRYTNDYTRAEVCETLCISTQDYNNQIRRLETVLKRVIKNQKD